VGFPVASGVGEEVTPYLTILTCYETLHRPSDLDWSFWTT